MPKFRLFSSFSLLVLVLCLSTSAAAQTSDRAKLEKEIISLREQLKAKEAQLLEPSAEDKAAFAKFLRQPDTGLIRLLPREKYEKLLTTRGGGAYYSFTRLTHEYGYGSDIQLEQGRFGVGFAGYDFGFFSMLGDIPLESVSLEHAATRFLIDYAPPATELNIRDQQRQSHTGMQVGNFTYSRSAAAITNATYLLRSISYRDSDVLVVFRVVRADSDGSMVLLWKMLKKFPVPITARQ